jgi:hypothetical protein
MWHIFLGYASLISFCIAHILDGNLGERVMIELCSFILWVDGNDCYLLVWKYSMWVDVYVILIKRVWQVSNKGQRIWQNSKRSQTAYEGLIIKI